MSVTQQCVVERKGARGARVWDLRRQHAKDCVPGFLSHDTREECPAFSAGWPSREFYRVLLREDI